MPSRINVNRRWLSEGVQQSYLIDQTFALEDIPRLTALFLVGEPGSGKTDTVREYVRQSPRTRERHHFSEVTSESLLDGWLQRSSAEGTELFLDAYDERAGSFLREFLLEPLKTSIASGNTPVLRIVSRGTHLPRSLVEAVREVTDLDPSAPLVYRLAPLTDEQVEQWARERVGAEADGFLKEIEAKQLGPYVTRPADLEAFVGSFQANDGRLGDSPSDAWSNAILQELSEPNSDRLDPATNIKAKYGAKDRLRVAEVLAVAQAICDPAPLVLDEQTALPGGGRTRDIDELWESARLLFDDMDKQQFKLLVRETVQSRTFEYGKDGISFASTAKSQFLAASLLSRGNPDQIVNILKDHAEGIRIPERAQPVAAEVSRFVPALFDWLCDHHPDTLLRGVVRDLTQDQRASLTSALLSRPDTRDPYAYYGFALGGLAHPGIALQLRPYLLGKVGSERDRSLAITIAEYCHCEGAIKDLATIAHDCGVDTEMRVSAAHALASCGPRGAGLLRPLLYLPRSEDPNDELMACALVGLWPHGFEPTAAFDLLRAPGNVQGLYQTFLNSSFDGAAHRVTARELLPGLRWLLNHELQDRGRDHAFDTLGCAITKLAWEHVEDIRVATPLARVAQARLLRNANTVLPHRERMSFPGNSRSPGLDPDDYKVDADRRWMLFEAWLSLPAMNRTSSDALDFVFADDVERLVAEFRKRRGANRTLLKEVVTMLVAGIIRQEDNRRLWDLAPVLPAMGVDLEEIRHELRQMRTHFRPTTTVNPRFEEQAHVKAMAEILDAQESTGFSRLLGLLQIDSDGWNVAHGLRISQWPRWKQADESLRFEIRLLAKRLLSHGPSRPRPKNALVMDDWDYAGLAALLLIAECDRDWAEHHFDTLRPWLPFLSARQNFHEVEGHSALSLFSRLTVAEAASEIHEQIKLRLKDDPNPLHTHRFSELWRNELGYLLARTSRRWTTSSRQCLLTVMALNQHPALESELRRELLSKTPGRQRFGLRLALTFGIATVYGAVSGCAMADEEAFELLWSLHWDGTRINSDEHLEAYGIDLLLRLLARAVDEAPRDMDAPFRSGAIDQRYVRQRLRDSLAATIARSRSAKARVFVDELSMRSGFSWLREVATKSNQQWLESNWTPPELVDIVKLSLDRSCRFIATQQDLHEAVLASLDSIRAEAEVQGVYWKSKVEGTPADEPDITQNLRLLLKPHLNQVVVNAEVDCFGGRTDIQVETKLTGATGAPTELKCVIEAKKCDSRELLTSLTEQLTEVYLPQNSGHTGIYLVLWFCPRDGCCCAKSEERRAEIGVQAVGARARISVMHFHMRKSRKVSKSSARINRAKA